MGIRETVRKFAFKCERCGDVHEGAPSFGYFAPYHYEELSDTEKEKMAVLTDDFCVIRHSKQTDRFIRVVLEVPIHGTDEPFLWGVWVSLSEQSFKAYRKSFLSATHEESYFGWLCNRLPYYPDTLSLKTHVLAKPGDERPKLALEMTDHPLAVDFETGISWEKAVEIAEAVMHGNDA